MADNSVITLLQKIITALTPNKIAISSEAITVSSTVIPFTTIPTGVTSAIFSIETNPIRYSEASAPTTTVGNLGSVGDFVEITSSQNVNTFKMVATGGNSTIYVTYYR